MILIISRTEDLSTDYCVEWFRYLGVDVKRINENSSLNLLQKIVPKDETVQIKLEISSVDLNEISFVWFRRGHILHRHRQMTTRQEDSFLPQGYSSIDHYLENENNSLTEFLYHRLSLKKHLSNPQNYNSNKIIALYAAVEAGLAIPQTIITNKKADVESYLGHENKIMTKPIQDSLSVIYNDKVYIPIPRILELEMKHESNFHYTLFQEYIDKQYEVRVFFIYDRYYAAAILSNQALVDNKHSRIVPYNLPDEVLNKLKDFNAKMGLDTGSIDLLVDGDGRFIFLEVNPVGQFDYVAKNCNYQIEKEIVEQIIAHNGK